MNLSPADIDAIASAVVEKLRGAGQTGGGSVNLPISPAELARLVRKTGRKPMDIINDLNGGK